MKNTHIEWCDHTFNPWEGCTKVSPGCAHCYAEARNARFGGGVAGNWGKGAPRRRTSASNWAQPLKWHDEAKALGIRHRVFCASLADVFDDEVPAQWRFELLCLIFVTAQHLDWLLLTKRPENIMRLLTEAFNVVPGSCGRFDGIVDWGLHWIYEGKAPANVWIGTSVENQQCAAKRIPALLKIPARVRFLSCEPLLEAVDLHSNAIKVDSWRVGESFDGPRPLQGIHWVIGGGESGPHARPMHPAWARSLRDQCKGAGVPFFFKQWGEYYPLEVHGSAVRVDRVEIEGKLVPASRYHDHGTGCVSLNIGKKVAGRLLDGIEHNAFPS